MQLFDAFFVVFIIMFSAVIHEVMHGYMADFLGDPTARLAGRLTLNPIPHLDPVGSIILPLFFTFTNSPLFLAGQSRFLTIRTICDLVASLKPLLRVQDRHQISLLQSFLVHLFGYRFLTRW